MVLSVLTVILGAILVQVLPPLNANLVLVAITCNQVVLLVLLVVLKGITQAVMFVTHATLTVDYVLVVTIIIARLVTAIII